MEHDWIPNEQQLITFYEANKGRLYHAPATVKVRQLSLSFLDANRNVDTLRKTREKRKWRLLGRKSHPEFHLSKRQGHQSR